MSEGSNIIEENVFKLRIKFLKYTFFFNKNILMKKNFFIFGDITNLFSLNRPNKVSAKCVISLLILNFVEFFLIEYM